MVKRYEPKSKRTFRKRRGFKRRAYRKRRANSAFTKAPMPNKFATKLRYVGGTSLNPDIGGIAGVHVVDALGCYDPEYTTGGHQPRGFDQLMTMYTHYTVIGSKITVDFLQNEASSYPTGTVGIALKDTVGTYADINDYMEGRNVVSAPLLGSESGDVHKVRLSKGCSTRKFMGVKDVMDNQNLRGNVAANPSDSCYFHLFYAPHPGVTTDSSPLQVQFRIEFMVVFTEPKQPTQS